MLQLIETIYYKWAMFVWHLFIKWSRLVVQSKIRKKRNMESKKPNNQVRYICIFLFMVFFNILKLFLLLFVLYFLRSIISLSNQYWNCLEFLAQNVRIISGMSGICDLRLEWQPWKRSFKNLRLLPSLFWKNEIMLNH